MFLVLNSPVAPGGEAIPNLSILHEAVFVSVGSPALQESVGCEPMAHTWAQQQGSLSLT